MILPTLFPLLSRSGTPAGAARHASQNFSPAFSRMLCTSICSLPSNAALSHLISDDQFHDVASPVDSRALAGAYRAGGAQIIRASRFASAIVASRSVSARVLKLVDRHDSGSCARKSVGVRVSQGVQCHEQGTMD